MANIRKSKKRFIIPICILLVAAIAGGSVYAAAKNRKVPEVKLHTITADDIYETVSITGDIGAGSVKEYKVSNVATVKEVFVKVGDKVLKDDVLATFDTESVDSEVRSLQESYDTAKKDYDIAVKEQKDAKKNVEKLTKEISDLEKDIAKLQKEVAPTTAPKSTQQYTTTTSKQKTTTKPQTTMSFDELMSMADEITTAPKTTSKNDKSTTKASTTKASTTKGTTAPTTKESTTNISPSDRFVVSASAYPASNYGSVTGGGIYNKTDTVTLKAEANAGYAFAGWYTATSSIIAGDAPLSTDDTITIRYTTRAVVTYYALFIETGAPTTTTERSTLFTITNDDSESTTAIRVNDAVEAITNISDSLVKITNDVETMNKMNKVIALAVTSAIASGQLDSDEISRLVGQEMSEAISSGMIDSAQMMIDSGTAVAMVEAAAAQIDYSGMAASLANSKNVELTTDQIQLAALNGQYEIFSAKANATALDAQKSAVNATKNALDVMRNQQTELRDGWKAAFDGTITSVDITPDTQTNMLSGGIKLENLNTMVANLSLGEYDVHKVKVGMPATIKTAYGTYEGEVATIAPTATGGGSSALLDNVGSVAGVSGLSSLTDSGAGVQCTVTIGKPDSNIIAGFTADVTIETGKYLGVVVVPIESLVLQKSGSYVYVYNEADSTVTKTKIETGAISDNYYQVLSGLKEGDRIIATPSTDYEEETFKVKVS
jgi:multidrug efflux pump subunit AcrA (membrane-fusion protein)